ncbi:MAG: exopolyphosphatase, partial [Steroidobacteraceae bacterium]
RVRAVATSALRDARNGRAFLDWVRTATGWNVEVITGLEEARLIHLGLRENLRLGSAPALLLDLGGGSCEITLSTGGHIGFTASLPLGAVRLTEEFLKHDPPAAKELKRLRSFINKELERVSGRISGVKPRTVIATSGTAAALAVWCGSLSKKRPESSRSAPVRRAQVKKFAKKLAKMNVSQRATLPGVGTRRAEIIVAGATVFDELLQKCAIPGFRYSPLGLRDGLLAQMAADYDERAQSRRHIASDRSDALLAIAKNYRVDLAHAQQVRSMAQELFKQMRPVHALPAEYAEWLAAAAMLHETGLYVNRYGWHRHAHYLIAHSEIFGYTAYERCLIAALARYLGNSRPVATDKAMKLLRPADRQQAGKAIVVLRMARALNQSRRAVVERLSVRIKDGKVRLWLRTRSRTVAELELWALEKERAYFREVFGRDLEAASL